MRCDAMRRGISAPQSTPGLRVKSLVGRIAWAESRAVLQHFTPSFFAFKPLCDGDLALAGGGVGSKAEAEVDPWSGPLIFHVWSSWNFCFCFRGPRDVSRAFLNSRLYHICLTRRG
jgi:hypothetical protein